VSQIICMMSVSLDGYMEGPNHDLDWQIVDDELHQHFNDELRDAGAFLDGRVTYELMAGFWPTADADPASTPPPVVEFAKIWRDKRKYVFSRTLQEAAWNTTIVRDVAPDAIRALRDDIGDLVVGGAQLAAAFRRHDLIDQYRIYVHPMILGQGTAMFSPSDGRLALRLVENRTFGSGVVLLRYERLR
jgi:dihydrofolate reductase